MKLNYYQFKIDWYNFKMFYVLLMETIKKISIEWTWKDVEKGIKIQKKSTKKKNLQERKFRKKATTWRKQWVKFNSKFFLISDYFKCK